MESELYIIHCTSNLCVGSGNSDFGLVGKKIQRDPVDNLPCISASSLRGAFRRYFETVIGDEHLADEIFGQIENKRPGCMVKGTHVFRQAFLLSIPIHSNQEPFYHAISPYIAEQAIEQVRLLGYKIPEMLGKELEALRQLKPAKGKPILMSQYSELKIEEFSDFDPCMPSFSELQKIIGVDIAIVCEDEIKMIVDDFHLPLIARNSLENANRRDLWFEQVIPRESYFFTFVSTNEKDDKLQSHINDQIVQIGGNSQLGYGYCKVYCLTKTN